MSFGQQVQNQNSKEAGRCYKSGAADLVGVWTEDASLQMSCISFLAAWLSLYDGMRQLNPDSGSVAVDRS